MSSSSSSSLSSSEEMTGTKKKLTLYGHPGTRSPLVNWAIYELGVEGDMQMGDLSKNPHPFGQIPCLADDEDDEGPVIVFESGAILQYLNQKYNNNDNLKQKSSAATKLTKRQAGAVTSWIAWANASLDPICFLETPDGKVYDTGLRKPNRRIDRLENILSTRRYLVESSRSRTGSDDNNAADDATGEGGEQDSIFTLADVAVASYLLYVVQFFSNVVDDSDFAKRCPALLRYMLDCAKRPAYAMAFGEPVQNRLVGALSSAAAAAAPSTSNDKKLFGLF